jgi:hypothetical protein
MIKSIRFPFRLARHTTTLVEGCYERSDSCHKHDLAAATCTLIFVDVLL